MQEHGRELILVKAFVLTILCTGLKIKTRTSAIMKANILAMHGPLAK